jgi:Matrixin
MNLPRFYLKHLTQIIVLFGCLILTTNVWSFNTFGQNNFGSKWDAPQFGTGAVVTWSFMTPGVALSNNPALSAWSGTNSLGTGNSDDIRKKIDTVFGTGAFDAAVHRAFATWAAAANLQFVEVADSGAPMAGSTTPDIRIGTFHFAPGDFAGAAGFGPPGNDNSFPDALAGDLALNDLNRFVIATGTEGTALPTDNGIYLNDVEGLLLHEIGHTLGLGHSNVNAGVMCGYIFPGDVFNGSTCDYAHVNHQLDTDDRAGITTIYGASLVGNSSQQVPLPLMAQVLLGLVLLMIGVFTHRLQLGFKP